MKVPKDFITVQEAAEILDVSTVWIFKLIQSGRLTKYKRMGRTYLKEDQVRRLGEIYEESAPAIARR